MVNQWPGVPATCLCPTHLKAVLAEYNNLLIPPMRKGHAIYRYLLHGCVDLNTTMQRNAECHREYQARNGKAFNCKPIPDEADLIGKYRSEYLASHPELFTEERRKKMAEMNKIVLAFRCPECRERLENHK